MRHPYAAIVPVVALVLHLVVQPAPARAAGWQPALVWAVYVFANPTTNPKDIERVREAFRELPDGRSPYLIRISDQPGVEGHVASYLRTLLGPPEVWLSRTGSSYRSRRALLLAGTIVHESAHLKGASELDARRRQLDFLHEALAPGRHGRELRKHVRSLQTELDRQEYLSWRIPALAYLREPMVRRKKGPEPAAIQ
jgi:hypothetical protein